LKFFVKIDTFRFVTPKPSLLARFLDQVAKHVVGFVARFSIFKKDASTKSLLSISLSPDMSTPRLEAAGKPI
jgi:hypothetical protein